jgi:hypothetical protein
VAHFFGWKKIFFYCPLTYNGNDRSHFGRSREKYIFSSAFSPLTYNGQKIRNIQGGSAMILKIYFPVHKLPLTYNGEEKQLFPKNIFEKTSFL